MNKLSVILLLLLLPGCTSCGTTPPPLTYKPIIDSRVEGYVTDFLTDLDSRHLLDGIVDEFMSLRSITLGKPGIEGAIGVCYIGYTSRQIILDEGYVASELTWKTLVYHELGHCLLNMDHYPSESKTDIDTEVDIMNTQIPLLLDSEWEGLVNKFLDRYQESN